MNEKQLKEIVMDITKDITHLVWPCVDGKYCRLPKEIYIDALNSTKEGYHGKVLCYHDDNTWKYVEGIVTFRVFPEYVDKVTPDNEERKFVR